MSWFWGFCRKDDDSKVASNTITLQAVPELPRLIRAAESNSLEDIKRYLLEGDDIDIVDSYGEPALFRAIAKSTPSSMEIVEFLLASGASVFQNTFQKTALICAVQRNQVHCIPILLTYSSHCLNAKSGVNSFTALHFAVAANRYKAAYLICQHPEVDVNAFDRNGLRAHEVCCNSSVEGNAKAKTIVRSFIDIKLGYGECKEMYQNVGIDIYLLPKLDLRFLDDGKNLIDMEDDLNQAVEKTEVSQSNFFTDFLHKHELPIKQLENLDEQPKQVVHCPGCNKQRFMDYSTNKRGEVWSDNITCKVKPVKPKTTTLFGSESREWCMWHGDDCWSGQDYLKR